MDLVIAHYHLNRGGVTRVIENHLRALATLGEDDRPRRVLVVFGGRAFDWNEELKQELPFELEMAVVPELEYDDIAAAGSRPCIEAFREFLRERDFQRKETILHIHNHSLGKNAGLVEAIPLLAEDGWRILLQVHDFAEDLRPQNYQHLTASLGSVGHLHASLYPQADQVHYAALNGRDFGLLKNAGVADERLHRLPNPVMPIDNEVSSPGVRRAAREKLSQLHGVPLDRTYVLYPVRGIGRKNLGEFLLWSLLSEEVTFALTLPPLNPKEVPVYESWKALAAELELPVLFEVGSDMSLSENYAAADAILTTSVAEGFGLVYLEAVLMNRPLFGRSLPGITDDFVKAGVSLPGLTDSMPIPASCVDVAEIKQRYTLAAQRLCATMGVAATGAKELASSISDLFDGDTIDFGRLDLENQQAVLRSIHREPTLRQDSQGLNPSTAQFRSLGCTEESNDRPSGDQQTTTNSQAIEEHFSLEPSGAWLRQIYQSLLHCEPTRLTPQPEIAHNLQLAFLKPASLFLIRLET